MTDIQVTGGKPSRQQQLEELLAVDDPLVRARVMVQIYDPRDRNYSALRDAYWSLEMARPATNVARVEEIVLTLGLCMQLIGERGAVPVRELLEREP